MPKVMWWMCRPPGVMLRNGPRSARIAWVMPRTAAKVAKNDARREQLALLAPVAEVLVVQRAQVRRSRSGEKWPLECGVAGAVGWG